MGDNFKKKKLDVRLGDRVQNNKHIINVSLPHRAVVFVLGIRRRAQNSCGRTTLEYYR